MVETLLSLYKVCTDKESYTEKEMLILNYFLSSLDIAHLAIFLDNLNKTDCLKLRKATLRYLPKNEFFGRDIKEAEQALNKLHNRI